MKYQAPFGVSDTNASYINGNPAAGIEGSIPPAAAFEYPMREIVAMINAGQFTPDDGDLTQLLKAIRRQYVNYGVDTGAVNALVVTLSPALEGYHAGFPLRVQIAVTNTGATVINVNGLGNRSIKRSDGSNLQAGDLVAGMVANLIDTGTVFQILNALQGVSGTSNTFSIDIPYVADTGTVNAILAVYSPVISSITEGKFLATKLAFTNTGAVTFKPNALPALPLNRQDGAALQAGDLLVGEAILIENHGTYYQVASYVPSQFPVAPKLRGFIADGTGFGAQGFATSTSGGQAIAYYHVTKNQLLTSSWSGLGLTVGTGEDGVWAVYGALHTAVIGVACNFASVMIFVNGTQTAIESQSSLVAGTGDGISVTAHIPMAVGDVLEIRFYHQAGTTVFSSPDNATRMSAFLISK